MMGAISFEEIGTKTFEVFGTEFLKNSEALAAKGAR